MKKILIVITTQFVSYGGITTVMMNYYRSLDKRDLHIDFASTNEPSDDLKDELRRNGSQYYNLGERKHVIRYINRLIKVLDEGNYDVIHVNGNSATTTLELLPACLMKISKRIIHIHNSSCTHKFIHYCLRPIFHKLYTIAIACSVQAGHWIFKNSFSLLPNAIDLEKYSFNVNERKKIRNILLKNDNTIVIGNVGKMNDNAKNHRFILECFSNICKNYNNYELWLVGDGKNRKDYEKLAYSLGIDRKVRFLGMSTNVSSLLSAFDIFLFPSLWEGMPLAVLEAQCAGLPCIISSSISDEVCVTDMVERVDLNVGTDFWAERIEKINIGDRSTNSYISKEKLKETGFDICTNAKLLREIYVS